MTRATNPQPGHRGGWLAQFNGECDVCDGPVTARQTYIVMRKGRAVHIECVNGGDDQ